MSSFPFGLLLLSLLQPLLTSLPHSLEWIEFAGLEGEKREKKKNLMHILLHPSMIDKHLFLYW